MKPLSNYIIDFPRKWINISDENPEGPPTFIREDDEEPGVLQISSAKYISGDIPNPTYDDLIILSKNIGIKNKFGNIINEKSGDCKLGKYGYVEFENEEFPFISIWHISNDRDFIFSSYISSKQTSYFEVEEVYSILRSIRKKKFGIF